MLRLLRLGAVVLMAACGRSPDPPAPAAKPAAAPAPAAAEAPLFQVSFNEPAEPAAPDHTREHPGPDDSLAASRAGYTLGATERRAGIAWRSERREGGRVAVWARSVDVSYAMTIKVWVSSKYAEGGCPYRVTWEHELDHVHAFQAIFAAEKVHLEAGLAHSQEIEPAIPTREAPALLEPDEVAAFEASLGDKAKGVLEDQTRILNTLMEDHRRDRDSPEAYARDTAKCPWTDW